MKNLIILIVAVIVLIITAPIVFIVNIIFKKNKKEYLEAVILGLDQFGGSIIYGKVNWSISGYTYYRASYKADKWCKIFVRGINLLMCDNKHCYDSYIWDITYTAKEEINNG